VTEWKLSVGCDEAGYSLKEYLLGKLADDPRVSSVEDKGVPSASDSTAYPEVGLEVAEGVAHGDADRALLICGTGIGMAISANKVPGVRATTAHDVYSVERSVLSNNCQVLTLGARVVAPELAWALVDRWLDLRFDESSPSAAKVQIINDYDEERG
jgi:ribose 5-phosphate isomerase B